MKGKNQVERNLGYGVEDILATKYKFEWPNYSLRFFWGRLGRETQMWISIFPVITIVDCQLQTMRAIWTWNITYTVRRWEIGTIKACFRMDLSSSLWKRQNNCLVNQILATRTTIFACRWPGAPFADSNIRSQ